MNLTGLDWMIVGGYFLFTFILGTIYTRKAGKSVESFFISDRTLPW